MKRVILSLLLILLAPCSQADGFDIHKTQITLMDSSPQTLAEFAQGKPLYLKFWASWCQPCMQQMPHFQHIQEQYGDKIQVLSINLDMNETRDAIQHVIQQFSLTMPIALDSDDSLATSLNFMGTPYHVLINKQGEIVHKGHEADAKLDRKIALLAADSISQLPVISLTDQQGKHAPINLNSDQPMLLFFSATWCDWYLEKTRPAMSKACIAAQKTINQLYADYPDAKIQGVVSHLWTEEKDLAEYVDKYHIQHPIAVDHSGDLFFSFGIRQVPALVVIKQGQQVFATHQLEDITRLQQQIAEYLP